MENSNLGRLCQSMLLKALEAGTVDIRRKARVQLMRAMLLAAGFIVGLFGFFWGLMALFVYLSERMSAQEAAVWIAGGLFLLAGFFCLTAYFMPRCAPGAGESVTGDRGAADPTAAMVSEISRMIAEHPAKAGVAALVVGLVVGYFPEVRSMLQKALGAGKDEEKP